MSRDDEAVEGVYVARILGKMSLVYLPPTRHFDEGSGVFVYTDRSPSGRWRIVSYVEFSNLGPRVGEVL